MPPPSTGQWTAGCKFQRTWQHERRDNAAGTSLSPFLLSALLSVCQADASLSLYAELCRAPRASTCPFESRTMTDAIRTYHEMFSDITGSIEAFGMPALLAPIASLALVLFSPVFFLTALLYSANGYSGAVVWESASAGASFVHGLFTCIQAPLLVWRHYQALQSPVPQPWTRLGAETNTDDDTRLLQFSCVRFLPLICALHGCFACVAVCATWSL